jgi:prepilin-type N-terminal cleavage/methylation domain-containing protein
MTMTFAELQKISGAAATEMFAAGKSRAEISVKAKSAGLSLPELMIGMAVAAVLTAMSVPVVNSTMARMRMNSAVNSISTAISKARYQAIRNSDIYTLAINVPQNTYVVTDVTSNVPNAAVPLPNIVAINGGTSAVFTYTLCPNGTVYGAGGTCTNNTNAPPALSVTYSQLQTNINVSTVGNVTTTVIR